MADAYANAEFQSRITLPSINENMKTANGELYAFAPTYGNGCVTYVKKAWLDAVGLSADDIKTFDDYYNMLKAFTKDGQTGVIAAGGITTAGLLSSRGADQVPGSSEYSPFTANSFFASPSSKPCSTA